MNRVLVLAAAALALTACGSRAPAPTATGPTGQPSATTTDGLPPTEAPTTPERSTTSAPSPAAIAPSGAETPSTGQPSRPTRPPTAATPLRLGVVAADRATFERLLTAQRTLGGRAVTPVWVTTCAQLSGVDLGLVQGETCAGKPFPVLAAGPGLGSLTPTVTSITALTVDDRIRALLNHVLNPRTGSLGVVVEACPPDQQAVSRTLTPLAEQRGFTVAATAAVPCGKAATAGSVVAALKAKRAAQVVFVSGADEAGLVRAFTKQAKAASYSPVYGVTSAAAPDTLTDQRERVFGAGWLPSLDVGGTTSSAEINDCLRLARRGGAGEPRTAAQRFATYGACDLLALADRALRLTHGSTDATAVRGAVTATGRLFKAASTYGSATDFRTRQTGPAQASPFGWSAQCSCFVYAGAAFDL